ncbi:MAG: hypothetical protein ACO1SV_09005 [Fimbriimonas sp.]
MKSRIALPLCTAMVAMASGLVLGQSPPDSPVKEIIRKMSQGADISTPERQRASALRFERSMADADPSDPWWVKAQYDLGYDLLQAREFKRAINAFEKVVAAPKVPYPGMRAAAADQIGQALSASGAESGARESAYRRALRTIESRQPIAPFLRMTQRIAIIEAIADGKGPQTGSRAIREWELFYAEGERGMFLPTASTNPIPEFSGTTWRENAVTQLRNLATRFAALKDAPSAERAFDIYKREGFSEDAYIAFAMAIKQAELGQELPVTAFEEILTRYPRPSAARAGVLAEALAAAVLVDDCKKVVRYGKELLAMKPMKGDEEDPARFFPFARKAMEGCGAKPEPMGVTSQNAESESPLALGTMATLVSGTVAAFGIQLINRNRRRISKTAVP